MSNKKGHHQTTLCVQQGVPPGPRQPVMSGQLQLQAPGSQQKGPAKSAAMPRQLNNQAHPAIGNAVRRRTRPFGSDCFVSVQHSQLLSAVFSSARRRTTTTSSSTVTSPDRRLTTSSPGGWWESSRGASSQVWNIVWRCSPLFAASSQNPSLWLSFLRLYSL